MKDLDRYLKSNSPWGAGTGGPDRVTSDDLFQTTELMFLAHLATLEDTDRCLKDEGLGRIHHRLLYIAVKKPGRTVGDVLNFLRVTNQNIHRPLGDLVRRELIEQRTSTDDRRKRELYATDEGVAVFDRLMRRQFERFNRLYRVVGQEDMRTFWKVLWFMMDEFDRSWLLRDLDR